jgi:hypothetical protein
MSKFDDRRSELTHVVVGNPGDLWYYRIWQLGPYRCPLRVSYCTTVASSVRIGSETNLTTFECFQSQKKWDLDTIFGRSLRNLSQNCICSVELSDFARYLEIWIPIESYFRNKGYIFDSLIPISSRETCCLMWHISYSSAFRLVIQNRKCRPSSVSYLVNFLSYKLMAEVRLQ